MVNMFIMSLMITCASAVSWPSGRLSIPKPKSGCPSGWSEGWRYQDNEDTNNHNIITLSVSHHFYGTFGRDTTMYYCTKTISSGSGSWPRGNYCIGRYDGVCPSGFCPGFIYWDDEDNGNGNRKSGVLPDGVYNRNTKINYCCRSDGSSYNYITLPTSKPFYLYKYTSTCQRVRGMTVRQESITMDDENERNASSEGGCHPRKSGSTKVDFCYYY
ncbi:unnamed protein product [Mytilus edulis]|uniref:Apextrin C-terminal domain-containing protein n=1 Tax=Mytilus edulis TaxID=6550 RepID=A0A8S3T8R2_MYTED|nr:unnamed protein product [Mytilus edulis]